MGPSNDIFVTIYGSLKETEGKYPYQRVITFTYTDEEANLLYKTFSASFLSLSPYLLPIVQK